MISTQLQGYYLSCFLSHQVAEKALGGLFLSRFGSFRGKLNHKWHNLQTRLEHVSSIISKEELLEYVEFLGKYYLRTRYPDKLKNNDAIPAKHFSKMEAEKAIKCAEIILQTVISTLDDNCL